MAPTSRLQGWDYIRSLMHACPECGYKPELINPWLKNKEVKWAVCCMLMGCSRFKPTSYYDNPYLAIKEWNETVKKVEG